MEKPIGTMSLLSHEKLSELLGIYDAARSQGDTLPVRAAAGDLLASLIREQNLQGEPIPEPGELPLVSPWKGYSAGPDVTYVRMFSDIDMKAAWVDQELTGEWHWQLYNNKAGSVSTPEAAMEKADGALSVIFRTEYRLLPWQEHEGAWIRTASTLTGKAIAIRVKLDHGAWSVHIAQGPRSQRGHLYGGYGSLGMIRASDSVEDVRAHADMQAQDEGWIASDWSPGIDTWRLELARRAEEARIKANEYETTYPRYCIPGTYSSLRFNSKVLVTRRNRKPFEIEVGWFEHTGYSYFYGLLSDKTTRHLRSKDKVQAGGLTWIVESVRTEQSPPGCWRAVARDARVETLSTEAT